MEANDAVQHLSSELLVVCEVQTRKWSYSLPIHNSRNPDKDKQRMDEWMEIDRQ